jgi:hypothetical protein
MPTVNSGQHKVPFKFNIWAMAKGSKQKALDWQCPVSFGGVLEGRI